MDTLSRYLGGSIVSNPFFKTLPLRERVVIMPFDGHVDIKKAGINHGSYSTTNNRFLTAPTRFIYLFLFTLVRQG